MPPRLRIVSLIMSPRPVRAIEVRAANPLDFRSGRDEEFRSYALLHVSLEAARSSPAPYHCLLRRRSDVDHARQSVSEQRWDQKVG